MIRKARIKLTLLYSAIFLLLFWSLSFGTYAWMNQFFGDTGKIHIDQAYRNDQERDSLSRKESPNDVIMDELRNVLVTIDFFLLLAIPLIAWLLTGNALEPVQKAQKREKQFLTNASHELRTPLSILRAEMEVALKKKRTPTEYQQVIQSAQEEVDDMSALVENLLFLSREQTKNSSPINEKIDLTDLIAECIARLQQRAKQKDLKLTLQPAKKELVIRGNPHLLKRLFTNLLENAIKYTERGSITAKITQIKELAIVEITDTGIGIPREHQEKIFDRFYRVDESRSEQGYGLGLSIAKQIMDVHRGTISVKSQSGVGTTMKITFPL